jgi:leucyl-tRNA synthetase
MSKSKGNGVNPDEVSRNVGADTLRVYEMFMGPLTQAREWDDSSLAGIHRFLQRVTRAFVDDAGVSKLVKDKPQTEDLKVLHKTIDKVTNDLKNLSFNTAIAQLMIFTNHVTANQVTSEDVLVPFLKLLSPFAPHLGEELWREVSKDAKGMDLNLPDYPFLAKQSWPKADETFLVDDEVTIGVQVMGKHRGEITISKDATQDEALEAAKALGPVANALEGKTIRKVIFVPGRILNLVAN